ncbi:MAG TPA: AAA family ATPase, partial [Bacteroidia bacterium]|nr:AAA family ATPase [Bacteroidia bacterium]
MIKRQLQEVLVKRLSDRKAVILLGPRQVGKSTLYQILEKEFTAPVIWWSGDESDVRNFLKEPTSTKLKSHIGDAKTVVIDEAQRIENIGVCIKLI